MIPDLLHHWADWLSIFKPDAAETLGRWLPGLRAGVGPLHRREDPGPGVPEGYGGLARRGPYERLILSEWAVAEAEPMEFDRRAAMGEHAFLELARRQPAGAQRVVVLLDAGPTQWGWPRLAQIALLMVMARRCEEADAELTWGLLQTPDTAWDGVSNATLRMFVRGRSPRPATADDLALRGALEADEIWCIGGPQLAPSEVSRITLTEPLLPQPGGPDLEVLIQPRQRPSVQVELKAPDRPEVGVHILRSMAFNAISSPTPETSALTGEGLWFSQDGRRLLGVTGDRELLAWHVPPVGAARKMGRTRRWRPTEGERLIAAGWQGRSFLVLTEDAEGVSLQHGPRLLARWPHLDVLLEASWPEDAPVVPLFKGEGGGRVEIYVRLGSTLLVLKQAEGPRRFEPVLDLMPMHVGVLALEQGADRVLPVRLGGASSTGVESIGVTRGRPERAWGGWVWSYTGGQRPVVAVKGADQRWLMEPLMVQADEAAWRLGPLDPEGLEVVGLIGLGTSAREIEPRLVALSPDHQQVGLIKEGQFQHLHAFDGRDAVITDVAFCHRRPVMAVRRKGAPPVAVEMRRLVELALGPVSESQGGEDEQT